MLNRSAAPASANEAEAGGFALSGETEADGFALSGETEAGGFVLPGESEEGEPARLHGDTECEITDGILTIRIEAMDTMTVSKKFWFTGMARSTPRTLRMEAKQKQSRRQRQNREMEKVCSD